MKLVSMGLMAGLLVSGPALADIANGPDPYAPGFGFDRPDEAAWGGWARGDAGTLYAEWDNFTGGTAGVPFSSVYGSSGTSAATFTWNPGTFAASTGNLYSFSAAEIFDIDITPAAALAGPVSVALQLETWGTELDYTSLLLNGVAPSSGSITYSDPDYSSSMGPVELNQYVAVWTLPSAPASFHFDLQSSEPHLSFAQAAVDIAAPIPEPGEWAMLLAGLSLIGAIVRRRRLVDDDDREAA